MFIRITFDSGQKVTRDVRNQLSLTFSDEVKSSDLIQEEDGTLREFRSWNNDCFDADEVKLSLETDKKKKLVHKTEMVQLDSDKEYLGELESFMSKFPTLKIKVRGIMQVTENSTLDMVSRLVEVQTKLEKALQQFDQKVEFNQKCDVHISNLGLLSVNQLGFATDKCTEELQGLINQGWRILAICPQPDQRRPDYILGRSMPNAEEGYRYQEVNCSKF